MEKLCVVAGNKITININYFTITHGRGGVIGSNKITIFTIYTCYKALFCVWHHGNWITIPIQRRTSTIEGSNNITIFNRQLY